MEDSKFSILLGMKRDFLGTSKYNNELFSKVYEMKELNNWTDIDNFMKEEFLMEWIRFKQDSYREYGLSSDNATCINNIQVYNIDTLATLKINAYTGRSKIRDLYDVVFICKNHWEELKDTTKCLILQGFAFKGFDYFDYISKQQTDELIDINKLGDDFLEVLDKVGLLDTEVEAQYAETFDQEEPDR